MDSRKVGVGKKDTDINTDVSTRSKVVHKLTVYMTPCESIYSPAHSPYLVLTVQT